MSMQADIRRKDVFVFEIVESGGDLFVVNSLYGRAEVVVRPDFRRNEQELYARMGLAELCKKIKI